jgi:hypothetical protein
MNNSAIYGRRSTIQKPACHRFVAELSHAAADCPSAQEGAKGMSKRMPAKRKLIPYVSRKAPGQGYKVNTKEVKQLAAIYARVKSK